MLHESKKDPNPHGYDPIEEDELDEDPVSATHHDLPDPDGRGNGGVEAAEIRERKEAARRRKRLRDAHFE